MGEVGADLGEGALGRTALAVAVVAPAHRLARPLRPVGEQTAGVRVAGRDLGEELRRRGGLPVVAVAPAVDVAARQEHTGVPIAGAHLQGRHGEVLGHVGLSDRVEAPALDATGRAVGVTQHHAGVEAADADLGAVAVAHPQRAVALAPCWIRS